MNPLQHMIRIRLSSLGWDQWHYEASTRNIYIEMQLILKHNLELICQLFPSASPAVVPYLNNILPSTQKFLDTVPFPQSSIFLYLPPTTGYTCQNRQGNGVIIEVCYPICKQCLGYSLEAWFILLKIWSFHKDQCHSFGSWQLHFQLHLCNDNFLKERDMNHCLAQFATLGKV